MTVCGADMLGRGPGLGHQHFHTRQGNIVLVFSNLRRNAMPKTTPEDSVSTVEILKVTLPQNIPAIMDHDPPPQTDPLLLLLE